MNFDKCFNVFMFSLFLLKIKVLVMYFINKFFVFVVRDIDYFFMFCFINDIFVFLENCWKMIFFFFSYGKYF